jgi:DNA-binding NtrC family response regulator
MRLARSRIPVYIAGEPGTGRRTLARSVARAVPGASDFVELSANNFDPVLLAPPYRRTRVVIAEFPELLDPKRQVALAIAAEARTVRLVAWGAQAAAERLDPELRYLLEPGWVLLPPLRERGRDVLKWAVFFLHQMRGDGAPRLSAVAEEALLQNGWPGNLRQLDAALRRAVLRREPGDRSSIQAEELVQPVQDEPEPVLPLAQAVERFRRSYVLDTLARFDGDRTRTAQALDVDPGSLNGLADEVETNAT